MRKTVYFEKAGSENTDEVLDLALKTARELKIKKVVVASTRGVVAVKSGEKFKDTGIQVIAVGHQYGFREPGKTWFLEENIRKAKDLGVKVHFATDVLTTTVGAFTGGDSVEKLIFPGGFFGIIAGTLRMFCQGMKVAVEISIMACDAGFVSSDEEVIAIAGTGRGADTVIVIQPANTHRIFKTRIREIVAKPR
jgi:hypothetical protein